MFIQTIKEDDNSVWTTDITQIRANQITTHPLKNYMTGSIMERLKNSRLVDVSNTNEGIHLIGFGGENISNGTTSDYLYTIRGLIYPHVGEIRCTIYTRIPYSCIGVNLPEGSEHGLNRVQMCKNGDNPVGRFGHVFLQIDSNNIVMFGGLSVPNILRRDLKAHPTDIKILQVDALKWINIEVVGPSQSLN